MELLQRTNAAKPDLGRAQAVKAGSDDGYEENAAFSGATATMNRAGTAASRSSGYAVNDNNMPAQGERVIVERRCSFAARDGASLQSVLDPSNATVVQEVDPALIFAMERTYLSAMNQTFYLMLLGTGLLSINDYDQAPAILGATVYVAAILYAIVSYVTHCKRLDKIQRGDTCSPTESKVWLGALFLLALAVAVVDLVYLFVYPVLERAKAVEIVAAGAS